MPRPVSIEFSVSVHVLTFLAEAPPHVTVGSERLAETTNTNPAYVRRVLAPLRRAGYVTSKAGSGGGWRLSVPPSEIALGAIWRLFDGPASVLAIHGPNPTCEVGQSVQRQLIDIEHDLASTVEASLNGRTVQTLVEQHMALTA